MSANTDNQHHNQLRLFATCAESNLLTGHHSPMKLYASIARAKGGDTEIAAQLQHRREDAHAIDNLRQEFDRYLQQSNTSLRNREVVASEDVMQVDTTVALPSDDGDNDGMSFISKLLMNTESPFLGGAPTTKTAAVAPAKKPQQQLSEPVHMRPLIVNVRKFITWALYYPFQLIPYGVLTLPRKHPRTLFIVTRLSASSRVCVVFTVKLLEPSHRDAFVATMANTALPIEPAAEVQKSTETEFIRALQGNASFLQEICATSDELILVPARVWSNSGNATHNALCQNVAGYISGYQFCPDTYIPSECFANIDADSIRSVLFNGSGVL